MVMRLPMRSAATAPTIAQTNVMLSFSRRAQLRMPRMPETSGTTDPMSPHARANAPNPKTTPSTDDTSAPLSAW